MAGRGPEFVTKDDLLTIAFAMRDAQNRFYRGGRHEKDKHEAMSLEKQFDKARVAYDRGINVAPPLPGFNFEEVKPR